MTRSIRWRLLVSYVGLTLLTVLLVGALALLLVKHYMDRREIDDLTANARAIAERALPLLQPEPQPLALDGLVQAAAFLGNARVRILDARQQNVLADSGQPAGETALAWAVAGGDPWLSIMILPADGAFLPDGLDALPWPGLSPRSAWDDAQVAIVQQRVHLWGNRLHFEDYAEAAEAAEAALTAEPPDQSGQAGARSTRRVTYPIGAPGRPLGYVELSAGPNFGAEALATTGQAFFFAGLGAMALAALAALRVSRGLTAPLNELAGAAQRMSSGDLSGRAAVRRNDEIGQLAGQFNRMAEKLQASFGELAAERDALRRFIADASHELRTPLTALKTFNDLLQHAAADDPAARAEFLAESRTQINRLEWITRHLLDLSRLEAGLAPLALGGHDLAEIAEAAVRPHRARASDKGIRLDVRLPDSPAEIQCDRAQIEIALSNLLANALKFTPAGGHVQAGGSAGSEGVRLWVRDDGPGIDPEDQTHIFDRFYRGKGSQAEGSGLGLAIVHSIVRAHGGRVYLESAPGQGSLFVIELP